MDLKRMGYNEIAEIERIRRFEVTAKIITTYEFMKKYLTVWNLEDEELDKMSRSNSILSPIQTNFDEKSLSIEKQPILKVKVVYVSSMRKYPYTRLCRRLIKLRKRRSSAEMTSGINEINSPDEIHL
ncbi:hypothetical protein GLOIN_2v1784231 [Rhizophagus irregularis DAOM 181602=DAOM 197198]|nr:hypothetical protein GLOIN_2v1784231 [Rhizophagus irregularis DAOM 181602=DAOM 197198]